MILGRVIVSPKKQCVTALVQLSGTIFWKLKKTREKRSFLIERVMNMHHKKTSNLSQIHRQKGFFKNSELWVF
jgi:hypothetical protein